MLWVRDAQPDPCTTSLFLHHQGELASERGAFCTAVAEWRDSSQACRSWSHLHDPCRQQPRARGTAEWASHVTGSVFHPQHHKKEMPQGWGICRKVGLTANGVSSWELEGSKADCAVLGIPEPLDCTGQVQEVNDTCVTSQ